MPRVLFERCCGHCRLSGKMAVDIRAFIYQVLVLRSTEVNRNLKKAQKLPTNLRNLAYIKYVTLEAARKLPRKRCSSVVVGPADCQVRLLRHPDV